MGWQKGGADEFPVGGERLASQVLLRLVIKHDAHRAVVLRCRLWLRKFLEKMLKGE